MLLFLYGKDTYRLKKKIEEIIAGYKKANKDSLSLVYFDCQENKNVFQEIKDGLSQESIFSEKKLFIVSNSFSNNNFQEEFLENKEYFLGLEAIILFYERVDPLKNKFFNFLKKNSKSQEFKFLSGKAFSDWILKTIKSYGGGIKADALREFVRRVGNDSWRANNEAKKLIAFCNKKTISLADVKNLTNPEVETNIFQTIEAIAKKDRAKAISLLEKHFQKGDSPLYILSMISYQFKVIITVKELLESHLPYNVALKKSGLSPFSFRKNYYLAQEFSLPDLKKIYQKIFEVDLKIKTSQLEPGEALSLFIIRI